MSTDAPGNSTRDDRVVLLRMQAEAAHGDLDLETSLHSGQPDLNHVPLPSWSMVTMGAINGLFSRIFSLGRFYVAPGIKRFSPH
jgi:hypothetical protein